MPSTARGAGAVLRDATIGDIDALLELERACFPPGEAYSEEQYRYALARAKAVNLLVAEGARAVAFAGAFHHARWRAGHVFTLNVHPDRRRRGLGAALLDALEARLAALGAARVTLEVNVANRGAIALYERAGYQRVGRMADYYAAGRSRDAFAYEKSLEPGKSEGQLYTP